MNLIDDEIRVKCAELDGWDDIRERALKAKGWHETGITGGALDYCGVPDYLNDLNAALTLCDRLREEGWNIQIYRYPKQEWRVDLRRYGHDKWPFTEDSSLARAICLAFLKTQQDED